MLLRGAMANKLQQYVSTWKASSAKATAPQYIGSFARFARCGAWETKHPLHSNMTPFRPPPSKFPVPFCGSGSKGHERSTHYALLYHPSSRCSCDDRCTENSVRLLHCIVNSTRRETPTIAVEAPFSAADGRTKGPTGEATTLLHMLSSKTLFRGNGVQRRYLVCELTMKIAS